MPTTKVSAVVKRQGEDVHCLASVELSFWQRLWLFLFNANMDLSFCFGYDITIEDGEYKYSQLMGAEGYAAVWAFKKPDMRNTDALYEKLKFKNIH